MAQDPKRLYETSSKLKPLSSKLHHFPIQKTLLMQHYYPSFSPSINIHHFPFSPRRPNE